MIRSVKSYRPSPAESAGDRGSDAHSAEEGEVMDMAEELRLTHLTTAAG